MRIGIILVLCILFRAGFLLAHSPSTEHELIRHPLIDKIECFICKLVSFEMLHIYSKSSTKECLSTLIIDFCEILQLEESSVCSSIVHQFTDEVLYVAGQLILKPDQFCGFILPNTCGSAYDPMHSTWNVSLPNIPKPPVQEPTLPQPDAPKLRVLQLTDIHYDPLYKAGTDAMCDDPLCCRKVQSNPRNGSNAHESAGFWGTPNAKCDLPFRTLENLLQHLQKNETFDYIIWTGDLPPHNIWSQSRQGQLNAYDQLMGLFTLYFPNKTIYSVVGNHESSPVDSFPPHYHNLPHNFSISWLYNAFAKSWTKWINESQSATIMRRASYVVKAFPGLRILSLNTMYCYGTNFWIYLNETDPDGVLAWLVEKLQEAETAGDKVHIIGHVPPTECLSQWSLNYYRIVNRYESTIAGQFFGHTHNDHFGVFYENLHPTSRPTGAYYVAPSVTTFPRRSPTYRIYTLDGVYANSSFRVLNHQTFLLNLTEANKNNATVWKREYDFKEAFDLKTLFPNELSDLVLKLRKNLTLFSLYNRFYNTKDTYCDRKCRLDRICEIRNLVRNYPGLCDDLFVDVDDDRDKKVLNLGNDDQAFLSTAHTRSTPATTYNLSQFSRMIDLRRLIKFPIPDKCKPFRETKDDSSSSGKFFKSESATQTACNTSFAEEFFCIYDILLLIFTISILFIFVILILTFWFTKSTVQSRYVPFT